MRHRRYERGLARRGQAPSGTPEARCSAVRPPPDQRLGRSVLRRAASRARAPPPVPSARVWLCPSLSLARLAPTLLLLQCQCKSVMHGSDPAVLFLFHGLAQARGKSVNVVPKPLSIAVDPLNARVVASRCIECPSDLLDCVECCKCVVWRHDIAGQESTGRFRPQLATVHRRCHSSTSACAERLAFSASMASWTFSVIRRACSLRA